MNRKRFLALCFVAFISLLGVVGLAAIGPSLTGAQPNSKILVSAAISLKDALEEIKPLYQNSKPGTQITYNFGASGSLQQQIEQGAPVDVFISAGKKQMDALQAKGLLLPGTRTDLIGNRLVLIVPSNSNLGITSFKSLTGTNVKRIAVGEPRSVPAGQYADQVFQKLGIATAIKSKLIYGNNVRQVLAAVETGNADAGIVYATDAKPTNKVKVIVTASETYHSAIVYPMAIIKTTKNEATAKNFAKYLNSNSAKTIWRKYGFSRLGR
jgi:molybdate transport system substrate-binding protein